MEQLQPREAHRTSFGEALKAARRKEYNEIKNRQAKERRAANAKNAPSDHDGTKPRPAETKKQAKPVDPLVLQKRQQQADARAKIEAEKSAVKRQKDRDKQQAQAEKQKAAQIRAQADKINTGHMKRRSTDRVFKINPNGPNVTGKILVRIDEKTEAYLDSDEPEFVEAYRQKLANRHLNSNNQKSHNQAKDGMAY